MLSTTNPHKITLHIRFYDLHKIIVRIFSIL
jgi:hypothetical protein